MLKELTQQDFGVETAQGVVLVDFYAGRCTPCQILGKLMPHLAEKYEGQAVVAKVDTQSQAALAQRLMIT
jgi:thioredoxin 1